jgi:hypothetical protein
MMIEIQDRSEIKIETEQAELVGSEHAGAGAENGIAFRRKGIGGRQGRSDVLGAGDPAAFLVDRENRLIWIALVMLRPKRI